MRALVAFSSLSGNTRDVARLVADRLTQKGWAVEFFEVGMSRFDAIAGQIFDLACIGSWSVDAGRTPGEVKDFIAKWTGQPLTPPVVAAFGTGETQWGEEFYCGAAHRLARFFKSPFPVLEVEQMPHSDEERQRIQAWTDEVLANLTPQEIAS